MRQVWTANPIWSGAASRSAPLAGVTPAFAFALPMLLAGLGSAVVATRFGVLQDRLVYNFDSVVDFLLPSEFHGALAAGRLPLWSDHLGLGFPLYAEGKIAAFYPPHWLIYQLPPLQAIQVALLVHLTLLAIGAGLVTRALTGRSAPAVLAATAMPLAGGVVSKLEWTNMVEAFAWLPWVLLPLLGQTPSRLRIGLAGVAFGCQALLGHPNVWVATGLTVLLVSVANGPRIAGLRRAVAVGFVGAGIGAVQLIPTLILVPLSIRANGLERGEFFAYPGTPFDILGFAFANVFTPLERTSNLNQTWYPSGGWGLLEAGAYVGLPIVALAAVGWRSAKARPLVVPLLLLGIAPLLWIVQPDWLASMGIVNALRRPTRVYMVVDFLLIILASVGLDRITREPDRRRLPLFIISSLIAGDALLALMATASPDLLRSLLATLWPFGAAAADRSSPAAILTAPFPVVSEIALGVAAVWLIRSGVRSRRALAATATMVVGPMALLMPATNQVWDVSAFDRSGSAFVAAMRAAGAGRVLTVGRPDWYDGTPNQLALAGFNDLEMHGSLSLAASIEVLGELQASRDLNLARALGVDTVVTFGAPCPNTSVATVRGLEPAHICHLAGSLHPPYWLPPGDVSVDSRRQIVPSLPEVATISAAAALQDAVPATVVIAGPDRLEIRVDVPDDGWVFVDRAWWPFWSVHVDGKESTALRAWSGQLVWVNAGRHQLSETLIPADIWAGLAISALTVIAVIAWIYVAPLRRTQRSHARILGSSSSLGGG